MAKPFDDLAGTGMHMHVSLADKDGNNLFASEAPDGTPLLRQAVGGMLDTLLDSLLMFCPNANSYRRFQSNSYAPLAATWGVDNRTVSLRVPGGPAYSRHIEHRICGADANPYLAAAAILAGIHRGIREQRDPGLRLRATVMPRPTEMLPTDWLTTLRALEGSAWAKEAFGPKFLKVYSGRQKCRVPSVHGRSRRAGLALVFAAGVIRRNTLCVGVELARDGISTPYQASPEACIASKPAPAELMRFVRLFMVF